jgi:hypothetical protein
MILRKPADGTVSNTGNAVAHDGGVAVTGNVGRLTVNAAPTARVRSAYLEMVRRHAPEQLLGRQRELAELQEFCTTAGPPYQWWRAPAWAGKSAFMSWFVLHPPAGVRVVSFFITARWPGQSDRAAFREVLLEQLAELLEQPLPSSLSEPTREAHLLRMLDEAAEACTARREQFVLVVDGLDEERGPAVASFTGSIAGLLPAKPAPGMRIVVTSRDDASLTADVPAGHPLRDPRTVRQLSPWQAADEFQQAMEAELHRLLHAGTDTDRDVLGLITVAGTLGAGELAELVDWPQGQIERHLRTVAGRVLTKHPGRRYALGHEQLRASVEEFQGTHRLSGYRHRLHTWAGEYTARGWPADTPEYLLRDYAQLVLSTGDHVRYADLAMDRARHDRMLQLTGRGWPAVVEVRTALRLFAEHDSEDVERALRLARYRDHLIARNRSVPRDLPLLWARLGRIDEAESLATALFQLPGDRTGTQALVAAVGDAAGRERAAGLAENLASYEGDRALLTLIGQAAAAGDVAWALAAVDRLAYSAHQAEALIPFAERAAAIGNVAEAMTLANRLDDEHQRMRVHVAIVAEVARKDRVRAEEIAAHITVPWWEARAWLSIARAADRPALGSMADRLIKATSRIDDPDLMAASQADLVRILAAAGYYERGREVADGITDVPTRAGALAALATSASISGLHGRVPDLMVAVRRAAHSAPEAAGRASALVDALIGGPGGDTAITMQECGAAAAAITDPHERARVYIKLVDHLVDAGAYQEAERMARRIDIPVQRDIAFAVIATAVIERGGTVPPWVAEMEWFESRARVVAALARRAAERGADAATVVTALDAVGLELDDHDRHAIVVAMAGGGRGGLPAMAREIGDSYLQSTAMMALVSAASAAGEHDRAEALAREMTDAGHRAAALVKVAAGLCTDDHARAGNLAAEAATPLPQQKSGGYHESYALRALGLALATVGEHSDAVAFVDERVGRYHRDEAFYRVIEHMIRAGRADGCAAVVNRIDNPYWAARARLMMAADTSRHRPGELDLNAADVIRALLAEVDDPDRVADVDAAAAGLDAVLHGYDVAVDAAVEWPDHDYALMAIAAVAVARGDLDDAEQVAQLIVHASLRAKALHELTLHTAAAGQRHRAARLARLTADTADKAADGEYPFHASDLAGLWAAVGEYDLAQEFADATGGTSRAVALAAIARWTHQTQARRLVVKALGLCDERWHIPLEAAARCAPDAVRSLARCI